MSKDGKIDDKDLEKVSGAHGVLAHLDDNTPVQDSGFEPSLKQPRSNTGGSQGTETEGTDGGGLEDLG